MPKYRHERVVCPCYKLSGLKLRRLASRTVSTLAFCRYGKPANASQPTRSCFIYFTASYYTDASSLLKQNQIYSSNQPVAGIFPAKLAAPGQSSNSAYGLRTVNNLPFPRKSVFFTHNLPLCLFLRLCGAENIPPQAERPRKEGRKTSPATWTTKKMIVSLKILKGNEDYHPA